MTRVEEDQTPALDTIRMLAETIGPRPAGSPEEKQAMDYLTGKLESAGYQVSRTPVAFAPEALYSPFFGLGALFLIAAGFLLPVTPIPALLLPFLNLCLPQLSRLAIQKRKPTQISENLFAVLPEQQKKDRLILCAHLDSGKMSGIAQPAWIKIYHQCLFYGQRIAIFLCLLAIACLMGVNLPETLYTGIKVLVLIVGGLWFSLDLLDQFGAAGEYAPGANDNASGVGVALELAKIASQKSPKAYEVAFLFTGAEETGLHGAQQAAAALDPAHDVVLNLDMVGTGRQLYYVTAEGTLSILRTDKRLNQVIQKAETNARAAWYTVRSGDFAAFLRHGIRSTSLELRSGDAVGPHYHTRLDQVNTIDPESLEYMVRFLKFFLAFYEDEFEDNQS